MVGAPSSVVAQRSDDADVLGLWPLLPLRGVELDRLTVLEVPISVTLDVGEMDEEVLSTIIRRDESVTLLLTEPLDVALSQSLFSN